MKKLLFLLVLIPSFCQNVLSATPDKTQTMKASSSYTSQLGKEFLSVLRAAGYFFHDLTKEENDYPTNTEQTPILLIHGHLHNSSSWIFHKKTLAEAGFNSLYTINLGTPFQSIESCSEKVRAKIDMILEKTGKNQLTLIGHSMGGVVALHYTAYFAQDQGIEVDKLITLGSPLYGSKMTFFSFGKQVRQMSYLSPFIQKLHEKLETIEKPEIFNIASNTDLLIIPRDSALLKQGWKKQKVFPFLGHASYLYSQEVSDEIIAFLRHRS